MMAPTKIATNDTSSGEDALNVTLPVVTSTADSTVATAVAGNFPARLAALPLTITQEKIDVANSSQLEQAIMMANAATAGKSYTIQFTQGFTETADPTAINLAVGVSLTFNGGGLTLDGDGSYRGLFVYAGDVTVQSLTIADAVAQGSTGDAGSAGGGGGGAGLGGGLFEAAGGTVTLTGVTFTDDGAIGGRASLGGNGINGGDGGGFGTVSGFGTAGNGGSANDSGTGGVGGFGAGGGGGAKQLTSNGGNGGAGGFGGGGGGGGWSSSGAGGAGGPGGFGGGAGSPGYGGGTGALGGTSDVGGLGAGGGGGLGAGGDIFVQQGGSLTIEGGTLNTGTVAAGEGSFSNGFAYGDGMFLQGNESITLAAAATTTTTIDGGIADQTGSGAADNHAGAGTLVVGDSTDTGTVVLSGANTFSGGVTLAGGTLVLASPTAAGTGTITFAPAALADLQADAGDTPANTIAGFVPGDEIDIVGPIGTNSARLGDNDVLTISGAANPASLQLSGSYTNAVFSVIPNGQGGTSITVGPPNVTEALLDDTGISNTENITSDPELTGTAGPSSFVTLTEGNTTLGTADTDARGNWTFTPTGLLDGAQTIVASQSSGVGPGTISLTFTLDTVAPAAPTDLVIESPSYSGSLGGVTDITQPTVAGTAGAGSIVTLSDQFGAIGTTVADSITGAWTIQATGVPDGVLSLSATATETLAGNTSVASSPVALTVAQGVFDVGSAADLTQAILTMNSGTAAGSYTVVFENDITEAANLPAIELANGVSVVIEGGGYALDGASAFRGLFVDAGAVTVQDLTIQNATALGGSGADARGSGGGGGGAGLGGGLFVAAAGTVTLHNAVFANDAATGASGGSSGDGGISGGGGDGGLRGNGANYSSGGGGGDSGVGILQGGEGVGGASGVPGSGSSSAGHAGAFGGGGGGGGYQGGTGGAGGFGGGGGGGGGNNDATSTAAGGGSAFGGGAGGTFTIGNGATGGGGGGGLGAGGDIFLQAGGSLTIDGGALGEGTVTGGSGGSGGASGAPGGAYGDGLFLQGNEAVTLGAPTGQTLTVDGTIADQSGSGGSGSSAGAGGLVISGDGTVDLVAANTYTGNTVLQSGTLALGTITSAGSGTISFAPSSDATLIFDAASLPTNVITGFAVGDTIILPDFVYAIADSYVVNASSLALSGVASASAAFQLVGDENDTFVLSALSAEPGAGTVITFAFVPAPTALTLAPVDDSGVSDSDDITNETTLQITGLGVASDTITLYDGTIDVGSGTVDSGGTWAITTGSLASDVHDFTATQTDTLATVSVSSGTLAVTIDTTLPAAPATLTLATASDSGVTGDDITDDTMPQIDGTGVAGDNVVLFDGGALIGSGVVEAGGTWSIATGNLLDGSHTLTAIESDAAGNASPASAPLAITTVAVPPAPTNLALEPASDSGTQGDDITNVPAPEITGSGQADEVVALYDSGSLLSSGTVTSTGTWALNASTLAAGAHTLTATETDSSGDISTASAPLTITIDTTPTAAPAGLALVPSIDSNAAGSDTTSNTTPAITGTGTPGETLNLFDSGTVVGTGIVEGNGTWFVSTSTLADGNHTLAATETDAAGNASAASAALTIDVSTVIGSSNPPAAAGLALVSASDSGMKDDDITNDTTPTIIGTGVASDTIALFDGSSIIGSGTVATSGTWSVTIASALMPGSQTLTATETNDTAQTSAVSSPLVITIDTATPPSPTLAKTATLTNPAEPLLQGTAADNDSIMLYNGTTLVGTVPASGAGAWQFSFTSPLAAGTYKLTATATDVAGNVSAASSPLTVDVNADSSYAAIASPDSNGNTVVYSYNSAGTLDEVDTSNASQTVSDLYDTAGTQSASVTQPGSLGPVLNVVVGSTSSGNTINLTGPSNVIITQGDDTLLAGTGADTVYANGNNTLVQGGSGLLAFFAGSGTATVTGGSGSETVFGGAGGGVLKGGGDGDNVLVAGSGTTELVAGGSNDLLSGAFGDDTLVLDGADTAFAGAGMATLYGASNDLLVGGGGGNLIFASSAEDTVWAGTGSSTIFGGSQNGIIFAGSGAPTIIDGSLPGISDVVVGGTGDSTIYGGAGNDLFFATGGGASTIFDGSGTEEVALGSGPTTLTSGSGLDLYDVTAGTAGGSDVISGFKVGTDQLRLFGYGSQAPQQTAAGGNLTLTLSDNTSITLLDVSQLDPNSVI